MTDSYDTLTELLTSRHSCRAFLPDPVAPDLITSIVDAARHTPSWCNAQPWHLTITSGDATKSLAKALENHARSGAPPEPDLPWPASYSGIYADRRRACGFQLYDSVGIAKSDSARRFEQMLRNFTFFDAPHVAFLTTPAELGPYGAMDAGGFATAFALAATAQGIATIPQAAVASYAPFLRTHLALPQDRLILCAISFGYADPDHPVNGFRTDRATASDIIDWKS